MISKKKNKRLNYIFNLFLFFYLIVCLYLSVNTGITTDELEDQYKWSLSLNAIKDFFGYNNNGFQNLYNYIWKYHGMGFHYFSHIYLLIAGLFVEFGKFPEEVSRVLLNHTLTFITFFLSAIFAKKIVNLLINDKFFSNIFLIFYLFYPYLLGHGFYNPKDMPFLFVWILSTYISIKIVLKIHRSDKITLLNIFFLSFLTGFLFSIRISGILILLQYFISFLIASRSLKLSLYKIIRLYFFKIFLFTFFTLIFTIIFYPLLWKNPLLLIDVINHFRDVPYGICTLTLGTCMDALNLPSSYILIWLFFKLPLLSFIGLLTFPLIEKKIFTESARQIILGSISLTIISIIFLLIFFEANIYDELRHILFLFPLILIVSFTTIYFFSKKLLLFISFISIFIFSIQNINMYPYQYTWFNLFGNFININNNFEVDYWGVSGRYIAKKININGRLLDYKDRCIYVSPKHIVEPFISDDFKCIKPFLSIYPKSTEQYILVKYMRNLRRENPDNCELIFEESYNLNLFKNKLKLGEVFVCN